MLVYVLSPENCHTKSGMHNKIFFLRDAATIVMVCKLPHLLQFGLGCCYDEEGRGLIDMEHKRLLPKKEKLGGSEGADHNAGVKSNRLAPH